MPPTDDRCFPSIAAISAVEAAIAAASGTAGPEILRGRRRGHRRGQRRRGDRGGEAVGDADLAGAAGQEGAFLVAAHVAEIEDLALAHPAKSPSIAAARSAKGRGSDFREECHVSLSRTLAQKSAKSPVLRRVGRGARRVYQGAISPASPDRNGQHMDRPRGDRSGRDIIQVDFAEIARIRPQPALRFLEGTPRRAA